MHASYRQADDILMTPVTPENDYSHDKVTINRELFTLARNP